ncbi:MAG: M20/M25/M40 family metallo-hydrolase [Bacteroidota bacterium]|nr:M20/M25/M40 family metallo-hydrolase [Bacteroidota bacterium]MDW8136850.1 M20/M25/M40 family metallo-hydrolase [Bacteroidota bacterium]
MYDVLAVHQALVQIPSLSHEEGPIADWVEDFLRRQGLPTGRIADNVYAWLGEDPSDTLLLNSHLDVVPPSEGHPFPPFAAVVQNGAVYGRGAVDAKASVAAMIVALAELASEGYRPPGRVIVALTACEELGGGYNGLEQIRPALEPLHAAIIGEPTSLQPCVAQKGVLILTLTARGRSAHAARGHLGENAILKAAQDILRLQALRFDREDPFLGYPTVAVTTISGGTARNVIPEQCVFTVDIRSTPAYEHEELVALIQEQVSSEVSVYSQRIVPVRTPLEARIVRACLRALPGAKPFGSPTASDWVFLRDLPVVKLGPGSSELSHTAQEHVPIAELRRAVAVYKAIIRSYFELP